MIKKSLFILSLATCLTSYTMFRKNIDLEKMLQKKDIDLENSMLKNMALTSFAIALIETEKYYPKDVSRVLEKSVELLPQYERQSPKKPKISEEKLRARLLRRKAKLEKASKKQATISEASSWPFCI